MYATYTGRLLVEATVETMSPLHIGSGHDEVEPLRDDLGEEREVAAVMRDWRGLPVIPPTTLKGVMRRLVAWGERFDGASEDEAAAVCKEMFGEIRDGEGGSQGTLVPYCAMLAAPSPMSGRVDQRRNEAAGTFINARTAIDPASGAAADHKLFHQTVVAAGARFKLRLAVLKPVEGFEEGAGRVLVRLLATLRSSRGIPVGRSRGDGWGRLQLVSIDRCTLIRIDRPSSAVESKDPLYALRRAVDAARPYQDYKALFALSLSTTEPFFVRAITDPGAADATNNTIRAMRSDEEHPELPGSSLMGALHSRAAWYRALRQTRGRPLPAAEIDGEPPDPVDRLFGESADAVRDKRGRGGGRTGWAGLLRVVSIEARRAPRKTIASVRIDRFSHAPMDGALFSVEAFVAPRFDVMLAMDGRASDADIAFARDFLFSLREGPAGGLMLGAASNRGFGWFDVEIAERAIA
jgi:CRISPR/Cas system CSM-associated protein Csm3 (group 7 of RAMP superfamily)